MGIFADHVETLRGGRAINLDPWILSGNAPVDQVLKELAAVDIPYRRIEWTLDDATERFRVEAGGELLFLDETQHLFDEDGVSPMARPGVTFGGFSYRAREAEVG